MNLKNEKIEGIATGYLLRVGVTPACNYKCVYCNPIGEYGKENVLSKQDIVDVLKIAADSGIESVHLTGGEPLLLGSLVDILKEVNESYRKLNYYLTTNGSLLHKYAESIKENGVRRVNISIDSLKPEIFSKISQTSYLEDVLKGVLISKNYLTL